MNGSGDGLASCPVVAVRVCLKPVTTLAIWRRETGERRVDIY